MTPNRRKRLSHRRKLIRPCGKGLRERKLEEKAMFAEKSLPKELLDILDYSDEEKMKEHIKILEKTYSAGHTRGGYNPARGGNPIQTDPVREAMGLK